MLFEKQQYQLDCITNIIQSLKGINLKDIDIDLLNDNITELKLTQPFPIVKDKRIDILMETGTGKTFTYLKAIFEIHRKFSHNKFIIVLPRTAIKQGVIQNIKLTKEYFFNEYGQHLNFIDYPKDGLQTINQNFINSRELSILITTNSAFSSDKNNINKKSETLPLFVSPWQGIAEQQPVVIIDEPHLLKGPETQRGLDKLTESLTIRFGATYPKKEHQLSNVVYVLDSIHAFNDYLVKQIGVNTLFVNSEESSLHIQNIKARTSFEVIYNINEQLQTATIRLNDDLGEKTQLNQYKGISVTTINANKIALSNRTVLQPTSGNYHLSDNEIEQMIKRSIELHFQKEQSLFEQGIKALALFFIPNIGDFRGETPKIKQYFEHHYPPIRQRYYDNSTNNDYKKYLDDDYENSTLQIHQGYFSGDKGSSKDEKEKVGIDLILNDKEALLSFNTPLRFIFSVWALQEGWDNPNIFTLCKLSSTDRETSRRQQIGRGLRLAVNQQGKRLTYKHLNQNESAFYKINALDMVVSSHEKDFIYGIQNEIQAASFNIVGDCLSIKTLMEKGLSDSEASRIYMRLEDNHIIDNDGKIKSPIYKYLDNNRDQFSQIDDERFNFIKSLFVIHNTQSVIDKNRARQLVNVKFQHWTKFKQLWETINKQSKLVYRNINEESLIDSIANQFNSLRIEAIEDRFSRSTLNTQQKKIDNISNDKINYEAPKRQDYFNRHSMASFLTQFSKTEQLPINFVIKLFNAINVEHFYNNPEQAQRNLSNIIEESIHDTIINHIGYQFNQTTIFGNALQDKGGNLISSLNYTALGQFIDETITPPEQYLYDKVVYDSTIEKDSIIDDPRSIDNQVIDVFAKLPKIEIPLPRNKTYNPDFAYLISQGNAQQLFLIVETKGYKFESDISNSEKRKINYAKQFFKDLQQQLPNITINYKTRVNNTELSELLREITTESA